MERILLLLPLAAYSYASFVHLLPGIVGEAAVRRGRVVVGVGAAVHLVELILAVVRGEPPGFAMLLSTASLGMAIGYTWLRGDRRRSLGMLLGPLMVVTLATAQFIPAGRVVALSETDLSPWLPVHLGLMFAGLLGFVLAFAVGALYLLVRRRLKRKDFSQLGRMPSLETLDRVQFRAMLFGFVFLTLGIGAGGLWAAATLDRPWALDPKVWLTLVIWAWYGVALQVRLVAGWRGRWSALFSIVGFVGLIGSLWLSSWVMRSWHSYG